MKRKMEAARDKEAQEKNNEELDRGSSIAEGLPEPWSSFFFFCRRTVGDWRYYYGWADKRFIVAPAEKQKRAVGRLRALKGGATTEQKKAPGSLSHIARRIHLLHTFFCATIVIFCSGLGRHVAVTLPLCWMTALSGWAGPKDIDDDNYDDSDDGRPPIVDFFVLFFMFLHCFSVQNCYFFFLPSYFWSIWICRQ